MNDIEQRLIAYNKASNTARSVLSKLHSLELTNNDIQAALTEVYGFSGNLSFDSILNQGLTASKIIEALKHFNFNKFYPEVLAEFIVEESLLPETMLQLLTEQTVKIKGEVWKVHKYDADPFPSNPHAHNYDSGTVLHLGNGDLFDMQRNFIRNIGCKKLLNVRSKLSNIILPNTSCK